VVVALADAYAACRRLAASHYENFPVASRLLPAAMRPHVAAVYAFARIADDFADEEGLAPELRVASLDDWLARARAAAGAGPAVTQAPPVASTLGTCSRRSPRACARAACRSPASRTC
jgi:phytoene/squalene synthetase